MMSYVLGVTFVDAGGYPLGQASVLVTEEGIQITVRNVCLALHRQLPTTAVFSIL